MLNRLKRALVESYVGAIALGYLLAQAILEFMSIFTAPLMAWASQKQFRGVTQHTVESGTPSLLMALPYLVSCVLLLALWYVLVHWLYLKPMKTGASRPASSPGQAA